MPGPFAAVPWLRHPWPREDESLLSWLHRFSQAQGMSSLELLSFLTDQRPQFIRGQPYVGAVPARAAAYLPLLAEVSGVPRSQLLDMVRPFPDERTIHDHVRDLITPYCPLCLTEDPVPYFRRAWLTPRVALCTRHATPLVTTCPHCGAYHQTRVYVRADLALTDWRRCGVCHEPLDVVSSGRLDPSHGAVWVERELYRRDVLGLALRPGGQRFQRQLLMWFSRLARAVMSPELCQAFLPRVLGPGLATQPGHGTVLHARLLVGHLLTMRPQRVHALLNHLLTTFWEAVSQQPYFHDWRDDRPLYRRTAFCLFLLLLNDDGLTEISETSLGQVDIVAEVRAYAARYNVQVAGLEEMTSWFLDTVGVMQAGELACLWA